MSVKLPKTYASLPLLMIHILEMNAQWRRSGVLTSRVLSNASLFQGCKDVFH